MKALTLSILILLTLCPVASGDSQDLYVFIRKIDFETIAKDYMIRDSEIKVIHGILEIAEEKYSKKLTLDEISSLTRFLETCQLSNLKESYINPEVEDGYQVIYKIKLKGVEFHTRTYNVYQPTMISICDKMNALLPASYHIKIPSKTGNGIIIIN